MRGMLTCTSPFNSPNFDFLSCDPFSRISRRYFGYSNQTTEKTGIFWNFNNPFSEIFRFWRSHFNSLRQQIVFCLISKRKVYWTTDMSDSHDPISTAPQSSSSSGSNANDAGDFECNICFDLPQDPVITLCGHLYCWPCLYRWLRVHSQCHECPVCKALIEEEKIIPLYGRGKTPSDPRSKPVPGVEIPNRPAGQRPETAPLPDNNFSNVMLGLMGGFLPFASASFSSIGMSAGFGGVFSPFFGVQFHGFSSGRGHGGSSSGYHYGYTGGARQNREASPAAQADDENLKKILCVVIIFVLFAFLTM